MLHSRPAFQTQDIHEPSAATPSDFRLNCAVRTPVSASRSDSSIRSAAHRCRLGGRWDRPQYPRPDQIELLRRRADIVPATTLKLDAAHQLVFDLPPEGVALLGL
jgi:hypothetical protein